MTNNNSNNHSFFYPISYNGNVIWPILFLFIFPWLGILLLILNCSVLSGGISYSLKYRGSEFWLIFWTIVFFPLAIILALIRGFDVIARESIEQK